MVLIKGSVKNYFTTTYLSNLYVAILPVIDAIGQHAGKECHSNRLQILALTLPAIFLSGFVCTKSLDLCRFCTYNN